MIPGSDRTGWDLVPALCCYRRDPGTPREKLGQMCADHSVYIKILNK